MCPCMHVELQSLIRSLSLLTYTALYPQVGILDPIVNEISVLWQGVRVSERSVHGFDGLCILLLELRVEEIDDLLDGLVRNDGFQGSSAQVSVALGARLSVLVLVEVLVNATLAEGVEALVDGVGIPEKSSAKRTFQE